MPELRKDYVLEKYVIIATERGKRPDDFKKKSKSTEAESHSYDNSIKKECFFCPGNEHSTPPEITRANDKETGNWLIRVFNNKFPAVSESGTKELRTDNTFYSFADAVGKHEVIVETNKHNEQFHSLKASHITKILEMYVERINALKKDNAYVLVFKNSGKEAGTSLEHSHSQLIATNIIPPVVSEKEKAAEKFKEKHGYCPYCSIIESEKGSLRAIMETKSVVSFCPYASSMPFEAVVMPKKHMLSLTELGKDELEEVAKHLKLITSKLAMLGASYNFYIHDGIKSLHLQITVVSRLSKLAGFELGSGININVVSPERAAEYYRS